MRPGAGIEMLRKAGLVGGKGAAVLQTAVRSISSTATSPTPGPPQHLVSVTGTGPMSHVRYLRFKKNNLQFVKTRRVDKQANRRENQDIQL